MTTGQVSRMPFIVRWGQAIVGLTTIRLAVVALLLLSPLAVEAQRVKIGLLASLDAAEYKPFVGAFAHGLREFGYLEGQNITFEPRFAERRLDRLPVLARELVELNPALIVVWGDQAIKAAQEATTTIPLVMLSCDVLAAGLVDNLARPSGNLTGVSCMSAEIATKRLEILGQIRPGLSRVGVLWNPDDPSKALEWSETRRAAQVLGLQLQPEEVRDVAAIAGAFSRLRRVDALIVLGDPLTFHHRSMISELATTNGLPAMYAFREFVDAGGLMSYGPNKSGMFRAAGRYAGKILKGARPSELPIEQPTQLDLFINVKAAKALGVTIPRTLLLRADHMIE